MTTPTILIADDDSAITLVLATACEEEGWNVHTTDDPHALIGWLAEGVGDAVITDVLMPKGNGLDFLPRLHNQNPDVPVIVISANNTLMTAVKAEEKGAFEYFPKPFDIDEVVACIRSGLARKEDAEAPVPPSVQEDVPLIGKSPAMQSVFKAIAKLVSVDVTVLLQGESGTGKEVVARSLHRLSTRQHKPFVAVNLAAIPKDLVESELFGHEKGAFTGAVSRKPGRFEQAEGGTLFLDEIGDMPLDAQTRLLRALQEREYVPVGATAPRKCNIRIICATHRDLARLVAEGSFREDLYYRIHVVPVRIPPLRERKDDIADLALHCLAKASRYGVVAKPVDDAALQALKHHDWPGNVRELENAIIRLATLSTDATITAKDVRKLLKTHPVHEGDGLSACVEQHMRRYFATLEGAEITAGLYEVILASMERPLLKVVMEEVEGNQLKAADMLGINRNTLRKKLALYGLDRLKRGGKA